MMSDWEKAIDIQICLRMVIMCIRYFQVVWIRITRNFAKTPVSIFTLHIKGFLGGEINSG